MQEELKLRLKTVFEGIEDAERYAEAINDVASAEERTSRAIRSSARASEKAAASSAKATDAYRKQAREAATLGESLGASPASFGGGRSPGRRAVVGPNTRLAATRVALAEARQKGAPAEAIADLKLQEARAQRQAGAESPDRQHERAGQAFMTSRFNAGPFQPLVGRSLNAALGPEAASSISRTVGRLVSGPAGAAGAALYVLAKAAKEAYNAELERSQASADLSKKIGGLNAAFGTSRMSGQADALGAFTGVDSGSAAFAFQQRIGTDPLARSAAAELGVSDNAAPYGSIDPGKQYLKAIKELAKTENEMLRRRRGRILGIEQEVERYLLLSPETQRSLEDAGGLSGDINNKDQMRRGAEFDAASERLKKAKESFSQAWNKKFLGPQTDAMNREADLIEKAARLEDEGNNNPTLDWQKQVTSEFWDRIKDSKKLTGKEKYDLRHELQMLPTKDINDARALVNQRLGEGGDPQAQAQASNTQAIEKNTQLLQYLNKNIGETLRTQQSAAPGSLRGGNLYDAYSMGALRHGTLG